MENIKNKYTFNKKRYILFCIIWRYITLKINIFLIFTIKYQILFFVMHHDCNTFSTQNAKDLCRTFLISFTKQTIGTLQKNYKLLKTFFWALVWFTYILYKPPNQYLYVITNFQYSTTRILFILLFFSNAIFYFIFVII